MNGSNGFSNQPSDVVAALRERLREGRQRTAATGVPLVTLAYSQSIDGCIAPAAGGMLLLSNSTSQKLTHEVRSLHDSILVGINTVLCDDPRLTVRLVSGANPQPVVLDGRLRFPMHAKLLRDPCVRPIIVAGEGACQAKERELVAAGATVVRLPLTNEGRIRLEALLAELGRRGLRSLMVEGGSQVITSFLESGLADHVVLSIVPRFLGGLRAVQPIQHWPHDSAIHSLHCQWLDGDLVVWGQLKVAEQ